MACIEVKVNPIKSKLGDNLSISRLGEGIKANIKNVGENIVVNILELSNRLHARVLNTSSGLNVKCSIICTLTEVGHYLEVTPADVQWITDDMGVFYDVESNVEWIIVTS